MASVREFRAPKLLSPEERRAFYAIPLQRKINILRDIRSRSVSPQSWAYSESRRTQSCEQDSLFSSQAGTASSASSISDITVLATSTTHRITTSQQLLHSSHPLSWPEGHRNISWTGGRSVDLESQPSDFGEVVQDGDWIEEDVCRLKRVRLAPDCQNCRKYNLGCNKAKPSCLHCDQNNQDCSYQSGAAQNSPSCSSDATRFEPDIDGIDSMPWLESLGSHPYHSLDGAKKIGGISTLLLKARRSKVSIPIGTRTDAALIAEEDLKLEEELLLGHESPALSEDDHSDILAQDVLSDGYSVLSSSTESLEPSYPNEASPSFYCLFCFEQFGTEEDWEEHETSQHFLAHTQWICMPRGPIEDAGGDENICMFCLEIDPDDSHCEQHKVKRCLKNNLEDRTYHRKQEFECHLEVFHGQQGMNEWIEHRWSSPRDDDWFWFCGFCDDILGSWTQRIKHMREHFRKQVSIFACDILASCCPVDKATGAPVTWFSPGEKYAEALYTLQELKQLTQDNRQPKFEEADCCYCNHCNIPFSSSEEFQRHHKAWHQPQNIYLCPTKSSLRLATHLSAGPLTSFLFPDTSHSSTEIDQCPYCGADAVDLWSESTASLDITDWEYRVKHLVSVHKFSVCDPNVRFYRPEQFLWHLAKRHGLLLGSWMGGVVESCRREVRVIDEIERLRERWSVEEDENG